MDKPPLAVEDVSERIDGEEVNQAKTSIQVHVFLDGRQRPIDVIRRCRQLPQRK